MILVLPDPEIKPCSQKRGPSNVASSSVEEGCYGPAVRAATMVNCQGDGQRGPDGGGE
jgi:hypothetical protein